MTYKLVSHESGKYTVEFDDGGCRPATDVEVALFKQRDELLAALEYVIKDLELRASLKWEEDERGIVDIGDGAYQQAKAAIASVKGGAA